jgi:hypothetical protein
MTYRWIHLGVTGLWVTFACGSPVNTDPGAHSGAGFGASTAAAGDASGDAGGENDGGSKASGGASARGGASSLPGDGGAEVGGTDANGGSTSQPGTHAVAGKVDLLLTIDNSISMAEKQKLFAKTLPELLTRLVNPFCVNGQGRLVARLGSPNEVCPVGSQREFAPLRDVHVGVITSSLGSHGSMGTTSDVCTRATDDDHAHLIGLQRQNVPSYDGRGFLKWDPDRLGSPPGETDMTAFAASLETMIVSAGEAGCGFEAPLEATYRFLVDPEPPLSIEVDANQRSRRIGIDQALLQQRADFLRPDSAVAVLLLTDENDCSIQDSGYGWLVTRGSPMYRATSACRVDPNDNCCQSCAETAAHTGCPPITTDSECLQSTTLTSEADNINLRCFDQKRRFGFDLLYPLARYVTGFSGGDVPNASGGLVPNPLFHGAGRPRDPSLFSFGVLAGVPWQDLATPESLNGASLEYLTASQLQTAGRWPTILGDLTRFTPAADPFMRESIEPRTGQNPVTHDAIAPSSSTDPNANPINGHEQVNLSNNDLQYACTFALPEPLLCDQAAMDARIGCDCFSFDLATNRSVCNPPGGGAPATTQYGGKAYPALRLLGVAKELGERSVLGSICSQNTHDPERPDYGYRPLFGALGRRIAETVVKP